MSQADIDPRGALLWEDEDGGQEKVRTVQASPLADLLGHYGRSTALLLDSTNLFPLLKALEGDALDADERGALLTVAHKVRLTLDLPRPDTNR